MQAPRIAVTLSRPGRAADPAAAEQKNRWYLEALEHAGAVPLPLLDETTPATRDAALTIMDALLITGGADLETSLYGEPSAGAHAADPGRDALDAAAFAAAVRRGVPVLGICRGLQAINVFSGGRLIQHLEGHETTGSSVTRHPLAILPGTRLASLLPDATSLEVNSFHHQAVGPDGLAPGLRISALARHAEVGDLVEGFEADDPQRWLVGIQCHPERVDSTPPVFEELWRAFVAAAAARSEGAAHSQAGSGAPAASRAAVRR
ncbi:MAG: gamma-glutamyl-gamma-aminobutyrate hydrolase family protein [Candidatus Limnocylindria bacterium]